MTVIQYSGGEDLNLPRLATTTFYYGPNVKSKLAARKIAAEAPSLITNVLTKSNKLTLIDRQYMQLTTTELKLLQGQDFKTEELARIGNRVGADYLIVGTVTRANEWVKESKMQSTGKVFRSQNSDGAIYGTIRILGSKHLPLSLIHISEPTRPY